MAFFVAPTCVPLHSKAALGPGAVLHGKVLRFVRAERTHMVGHHHLESPDAGLHNSLIHAGEQPYEVGHTAACNHSAQAIFNAIG